MFKNNDIRCFTNFENLKYDLNFLDNVSKYKEKLNRMSQLLDDVKEYQDERPYNALYPQITNLNDDDQKDPEDYVSSDEDESDEESNPGNGLLEQSSDESSEDEDTSASESEGQEEDIVDD